MPLNGRVCTSDRHIRGWIICHKSWGGVDKSCLFTTQKDTNAKVGYLPQSNWWVYHAQQLPGIHCSGSSMPVCACSLLMDVSLNLPGTLHSEKVKGNPSQCGCPMGIGFRTLPDSLAVCFLLLVTLLFFPPLLLLFLRLIIIFRKLTIAHFSTKRFGEITDPLGT